MFSPNAAHYLLLTFVFLHIEVFTTIVRKSIFLLGIHMKKKHIRHFQPVPLSNRPGTTPAARRASLLRIRARRSPRRAAARLCRHRCVDRRCAPSCSLCRALSAGSTSSLALPSVGDLVVARTALALRHVPRATHTARRKPACCFRYAPAAAATRRPARPGADQKAEGIAGQPRATQRRAPAKPHHCRATARCHPHTARRKPACCFRYAPAAAATRRHSPRTH